MSYKVHIDSYSGPFDLLLYLVSRQKVDIGVISITSIIDQYLEEMEHIGDVDLDVASDFLLVAATLRACLSISSIKMLRSHFIAARKQNNVCTRVYVAQAKNF